MFRFVDFAPCWFIDVDIVVSSSVRTGVPAFNVI
jgi:hypothetical protein